VIALRSVAKRWCSKVTQVLARPISDVGPFDRVVLLTLAQEGKAVHPAYSRCAP
jgi:hypothetical protein